jgi:KaiC/GvpD/RAD55 family RecA-like ATPase
MSRTVSTGDIGMDVILGGGWRLVERIPGRESATVVLRGGPGTGKTLLAADVALALARALSGDVVVACVELLPSEYVAQLESGRSELMLQWRDGPKLSQTKIVILPQETRASSSESPRIFCGLLPELSGAVPDLVAALESLQREVVSLDGKPAVFVVDSLIAGYHLGPSLPRQNVDAVMKFAAQEGVGLVLCEEATGEVASSWDFAADTVLELEHHRTDDRQIVVRKHRFGPSATGVHQLEIRGWRQPRVAPRPDAWLDGRKLYPTLSQYGWKFLNGHGYPPLTWIDDLLPSSGAADYAAALAVVSVPHLELARKLAFGLVPVGSPSQVDVVIDLDPISARLEGWSSRNISVCTLPVALGAKVAICEIVEYLGQKLFVDTDSERPRRILIGDLATVVGTRDVALWVESICVIAMLVAESGWGIPLIVYDSSSATASKNDIDSLRARADLTVDAVFSENSIAVGHVDSRLDGVSEVLHWPTERLCGPWPEEIARMARLHGPDRGRSFIGPRKARRRNRVPKEE